MGIAIAVFMSDRLTPPGWLPAAAPGAGQPSPASAAQPDAFAAEMRRAISQVSQAHTQAQAQVRSFANGQGSGQEVLACLHQARVCLQEMVALRQQLLSAYQDLQQR